MSKEEAQDAAEGGEGLGPKFPFPVFFLLTAQCPYVQKRVAQVNRQRLLDMPEGAFVPGSGAAGGAKKKRD